MMKFKIISISILLLSCGQGEAPHSETLDYRSSEYHLYVTPGQGGGFCVYDRLRNGKTALITTKGALSAEQLGQALSYMSYWSQAVSAALPTASWGYFSVKIVQNSIDVFEKSVANQAFDLAGSRKFLGVTIGALLLWGAANTVNGLYRLIKGNYEGEKGGAIAAQFFFGWMPFNFLIEDMQRRGRVETLANDYERVRLSNRKLSRIIKKLRNKTPAFPAACPAVSTK